MSPSNSSGLPRSENEASNFVASEQKTGSRFLLYLTLLRIGFAKPSGYPDAGGLLPRHFTLTPTESRRCIFCCIPKNSGSRKSGTFRDQWLSSSVPRRYLVSCSTEFGLSSLHKLWRATTFLTSHLPEFQKTWWLLFPIFFV